MKINAHLSFNGQCEEAFKFYERLFKGKMMMMMTYGESPMAKDFPKDMGNKIIHAALVIGEQGLTGGDAPPKMYQKAQGMTVALNVDTAEETNQIFKALAEKGEVKMAVQETFWAKAFGVVIDRFGTPWMINCSKK